MIGAGKDLFERLRSLWTRDREARELAEEMRFHLEREIESNRAKGMSPHEARRQAHISFGGVDRWTEEWREARGVGFVERCARDVRLACRRFRREATLTLPAVLTIALGVAVTTAVFVLVHAILLRPLPFHDDEALVDIAHVTRAGGLSAGQSSGTYAHYRAGNRTFIDVALYFENRVGVSVTDGVAPEPIRVAMVTPGFFSILGVAPELGRWFTEEDASWEPGEPRTPVIISHDLWIRRYGGDRRAIGGTIELNQSARNVVGVMPAHVRFPHADTDVWYVFTERPERAQLGGLDRKGIARLRTGATMEDAENDLARLAATLPAAYPDVEPADVAPAALRPTVTPLRAHMVSDVRTPILLLGLSAVFVLIVSLANVGGLFLVRAERRRQELAVARSIGASLGDLAHRFAAEGLVIGVAGGTLGILGAGALVDARFGLGPAELPRLHELEFGALTLAVGVAIALLSGLWVAGLSFARARALESTTSGLAAGARQVGGRGWRTAQRGLATLQVALSLALLVSSAVMLESLSRLTRVDPGFEAQPMLTFRINPPSSQYQGYDVAATLHRELRDRISAVPGVRGAEAAARLPLTPVPPSLIEPVEAADAAPGADTARAALNIVTPGYFDLMGIPIQAGAAFGDLRAGAEAPPVVVSARLARTIFGTDPAVGRRIRFSEYVRDQTVFTVAGVVGDVPGERLADAFEPTLYMPAILDAGADAAVTEAYPFVPGVMAIVVSTDGDPASLVAPIRAILRDIDDRLPLASPRSLDEILRSATARLRLVTWLSLVAATASLLLGVTGVYSIVAYSVSQRVPELGLRMALGSSAPLVERLILRQALAIALLGLVIGVPLAYAFTGVLRGVLYDLGSGSATATLAASTVLTAVVLIAGWIPARRAGRLDAVQALRAH